jgi:hypothetical protein
MDLVPLDVVGELIDSEILKLINGYVREGKVDNLYKALRLFISGSTILNGEFPDKFTAVIELSKHYEAGCKKYGDRNWEKGIPLHCYIDSACRHLMKHYRGDKDENHYLAFVWNLTCAIWTHRNKPELIDLPFKDNKSQLELGTHIHGDVPPINFKEAADE